VTARTLAVSAVVCAVLVVVGHQLFDLSWESALVLAPVFVLSAGAAGFLLVLWAKVIYESLRTRSRAVRSDSRSDSSL
jgi:Ni/Fe-hydrogenase subunit HybB-like protein